jgi:1,2-phenylacetyl-CoA epoxidase catalytic subunit
MTNLDKLPSLETLLGQSLDENTSNGEDLLGYNSYNFLENCNIPIQIKLKIEKDIVFEDFMLTCLTEEKSVEWLCQWHTLSDEVYKKFIFLQIANDEYKHSLIYLNLLILLFPEKDIKKEYLKQRNQLTSNGFWSHFYEDDLDFQIFKHFINETLIIGDMRLQARMSMNPLVRQCLTKVAIEESNHINLGKQIIFNLTNKNKIKKIILLRIKQVLKNGVGVHAAHQYQKIMHSYGINFLDHFEDMKQSRRAKDYTTSTINELFNFGKFYYLFNNPNLESFLESNDLLTNYKKYL